MDRTPHLGGAIPFAALALLPAASRAALGPPEDVAASCTLRVDADRDRLQLGADAEAMLELAGPPDIEDVRVTTQAGHVEDLVAIGPGRFTARYRPPAETYPQIAIIAAAARCASGSAHGWTALPLWGSGQAVIRTRRGAKVGVDIAGTPFGPVRAGPDGIALIPVQVPPGVRWGHDGKKSVDLKLPPMSRAHVLPDREAVRADRDEIVALRVFAIDESGAPADRAPELSASRGRISSIRPATPGVWIADLRLDPGEAGPVEVRVRADASEATAVSLDAVAGPVAAVEVILPEGPIRADTGAPLDVRVKAADAAGNPTGGGDIRVSTNLGALDAPRSDSAGLWIVPLAIPSHFSGHDRLRVVARARGERGEVEGFAVRPLQAGDPARVEVRAPRGAVADGSTPVTLVVAVRDRHGNRVVDPPAVRASKGKIGRIDRRGDGFLIRWTPPAEEDPTVGDVAVRAGAVERRAEVGLRPRPRRLTMGAKGGALRGTGNLSMLSFAAEGGAGLPLFGQPTWLLVEAGYQRGAARAPVTSGSLAGTDATSQTQAFSMIGSVAWRPRLGRWLVPSAALGGGAMFVHNRTGVAEQPDVVDRQVAAVVQLALGLGVRLGPGQAFVEGSYRFAADANRPSLTGPLSAAGVHLGYALELF
jgi:hypothetical protein